MMSLVAKNTASIVKNEPIKLFRSHKDGFQDGGQLRDFVYVKDCTSMMMWLFESQPTSGIFNMGTGQARSFLDLMKAIGLALEKPILVEYIDIPENIRNQYQYFTEAKMDKIKNIGNTVNLSSIEAGVRDYVINHLVKEDVYR